MTGGIITPWLPHSMIILLIAFHAKLKDEKIDLQSRWFNNICLMKKIDLPSRWFNNICLNI